MIQRPPAVAERTDEPTPQADATERAQNLRDCGRPELTLLQQWQVNQVASALQQYGDERAREARETAKEEYESANLANQQVFAAAIRRMAEKTTIWQQASEAAIEVLTRRAEQWGDEHNRDHRCSMIVRNELGAAIADIRAAAE